MSVSNSPGIVVLGGINMDLVTYSERFPAAGETVVGRRFLTYAGGKGANQAVAAARMGGRTSMVGQVGADLFGPQLLDGLTAAGVDVSGIAVAEGETSGIAVISIDGSAQNRIVQVLGANSTCGPAQSDAAGTAVAGASVLMLQLEVPVEVSLAAARAAKAAGKTVILDPGPVRPFPEELLQLADVITPNETEAEALVGFPVNNIAAAERAAGELLRRGRRDRHYQAGSAGGRVRHGLAGRREPLSRSVHGPPDCFPRGCGGHRGRRRRVQWRTGRLPGRGPAIGAGRAPRLRRRGPGSNDDRCPGFDADPRRGAGVPGIALTTGYRTDLPRRIRNINSNNPAATQPATSNPKAHQ